MVLFGAFCDHSSVNHNHDRGLPTPPPNVGIASASKMRQADVIMFLLLFLHDNITAHLTGDPIANLQFY